MVGWLDDYSVIGFFVSYASRCSLSTPGRSRCRLLLSLSRGGGGLTSYLVSLRLGFEVSGL